MDELIHTSPSPTGTQGGGVRVERRGDEAQRDLVHRHAGRFGINLPTHDDVSSKQVQYNMPIFANFDRVIHARPSHTSLTASEVAKAELVQAMYHENRGRGSASEYIERNAPNWEIVERVNDNVMVVTNKTTNNDAVVIKGIDPTNVDDLADLSVLLADRSEHSPTYESALEAAIEYNATEIISHSRGSAVGQAVAQNLGIESTGFNSVITGENVRKAHYAPPGFRHTEFMNAEDHIVGSINDIVNPHRAGMYPNNMEIRTFAGIAGEDMLGNHKMGQWTAAKLNRNDTISLPAEELAFRSRHVGDLITGEMFRQGIAQGKSYREILLENENGFGIIDANGAFTPRNFEGNNMSQIFQAVGGVHDESELREMRLQGTQQPHEHTLTENELAGLERGAGVDMIEHHMNELAGNFDRLAPVTQTAAMTIGKGIYRGVADSFKTGTFVEGMIGGVIGEVGANTIDHVIGRMHGELGNIQHSGESFGIAAGAIGGLGAMGYGFAAGVGGEVTRYGTDTLLKKLGASDELRGHLDAAISGAASGAIMGSAAGPVGSAIGAGVGAILSEGAHLATEYGSKIKSFFDNLF